MTKKKIKKEPVDNDSPMSMYDKMIGILEKKGLGDDPLAKQLRKNKELDIINEGKSFREMYYGRPVAFHKDDK